ncbi:MAG: GYD domain-containing protein [Nitrospirota bacterium]
MPIYVSLVKFTEHGISTMKQQGIARSEGVQKNIESLGGRLLDAYYCLGDYDVVAILEFPNNRAAMKAAVLNSAMGHIRITTMPAVSRGEWRELLREVWSGKSKRT